VTSGGKSSSRTVFSHLYSPLVAVDLRQRQFTG